MEPDEEPKLSEALASAAQWLQARRAPTRHVVRPLLLGLGRARLAGQAALAQGDLERVAGWIREQPEPWGQAIASDLSMAVTEIVRSADPRWLSHPRYDWGYFVKARQEVEERLAAMRALGMEVDEELLAALERADLLVAPHLGGGGIGTP